MPELLECNAVIAVVDDAARKLAGRESGSHQGLIYCPDQTIKGVMHAEHGVDGQLKR